MRARLTGRDILSGCILAEFRADEPFAFRPGEYAQIVLADDLKHYFSITSSPGELPALRIAAKKSQSKFKQTLQAMPLGTEVEINGPWGDLWLPEDERQRSYYFIAGGIGITPFMSMIKYKVEQNLPYEMNLLYFSDSDPIFRADLENLANRSAKVRVLFIHEKISAEVINKFANNIKDSTTMIAGPPGFVNSAVSALQNLQIPQKSIIFESYTGY